MRPIFLVVPALVAFVAGAQRRTPCDLVIRNVSLFDGQHARGIIDIAIRDDTIVQIAHGITTCVDHDTIDGAGKFVVPGLINSHVHLWEKENLKAALDIGVFAVIDLHSSEGPDQMLRGLRDSSVYASYFSSGIAATSPKGHPTELFPIETINDSVTPSQFVEHHISKGADLIKIVSNSPNPDSQWRSDSSLTYRQIGEIADAARSRHKRVVVHISHVDEAVRIAEFGVDGFAHLWSYNESASDEQLRQLRKAGIFIIPTALTQQKAWQAIDRKPTERHDFLPSLSPMTVVYREIKRAHDAGIPIVAGTDPPNWGINYHDDLFEELAIYSKAGLSNQEVLRTTTGTPSAVFHLDGIGTIKEGTKANFLLLNSDPLKNLSALRDIAGMWHNGKRIR